MGQLDVTAEMLVKGRCAEVVNSLGYIATRGLDRDVIVLLEVDTGLLFGRVVDNAKQFTLETCVGRASNMLAVMPSSIARAASTIAATLATALTTAALAAIVASSLATTATAASPTTSSVIGREVVDRWGVLEVVLAGIEVLAERMIST